jgi:hypothetical protein
MPLRVLRDDQASKTPDRVSSPREAAVGRHPTAMLA